MTIDPLLQPVLDAVTDRYQDIGPCHDLSHVLRVAALAEGLALAEGIEPLLPTAAALLHDAGRSDSTGRDHAEVSAEIGAQLLHGLGWEPEAVEAVTAAIRAHRFHNRELPGGDAGDVARILLDADRLDAIGLVGVSRAYLYLGEHGWELPAEPEAAALWNVHALARHWEAKLRHIPGRMLTSAGRAEATHRIERMENFIDGLTAEVTALPTEAAVTPSGREF